MKHNIGYKVHKVWSLLPSGENLMFGADVSEVSPCSSAHYLTLETLGFPICEMGAILPHRVLLIIE